MLKYLYLLFLSFVLIPSASFCIEDASLFDILENQEDLVVPYQSVVLLPDSNVNLRSNLYKVATYIKLAELGCPVMKSALILDKSGLSKDQLHRIIDHLGGQYTSLRYQYKVPCDKPKRGGKKVPIEAEQLLLHWDDELILWPVAHVDRVKNRYGINILYQPNTRIITYEIVGQGFDGTDLNKGDLSPHQIIEVPIPGQRGLFNDVWSHTSVYTVDQAKYEQSVDIRRKKLLALNVPEEEIIIPNSYAPISKDLIELLDEYANLVFAHFNYKKEANISATVMENNQIIFWDFQTPQNKSAAFGSHDAK